MFALSSNVKQFYLTQTLDPIRCFSISFTPSTQLCINSRANLVLFLWLSNQSRRRKTKFTPAIVVKLVTVVEVDPKASFSIATTPRCRGGCYSYPWIAPPLPLICTLYCWVLSKAVSSTIFKVFDMTRPGIEPSSPGPLANTLLTWSIDCNLLKNWLCLSSYPWQRGWVIIYFYDEREMWFITESK